MCSLHRECPKQLKTACALKLAGPQLNYTQSNSLDQALPRRRLVRRRLVSGDGAHISATFSRPEWGRTEKSLTGSQHPSPNVKNFPRFEPQIWPDIITTLDAESTCLKAQGRHVM